jgi:hypothetical protein
MECRGTTFNLCLYHTVANRAKKEKNIYIQKRIIWDIINLKWGIPYRNEDREQQLGQHCDIQHYDTQC